MRKWVYLCEWCESVCESGLTIYGSSVDQPLDVGFRVSIGPTHQSPVLIWGQHQIGRLVQPIGSSCGRDISDWRSLVCKHKKISESSKLNENTYPKSPLTYK